MPVQLLALLQKSEQHQGINTSPMDKPRGRCNQIGQHLEAVCRGEDGCEADRGHALLAMELSTCSLADTEVSSDQWGHIVRGADRSTLLWEGGALGRDSDFQRCHLLQTQGRIEKVCG